MNEEFREQRVRLLQAMAETADPFTRKRLLNLVARYERIPRPPTPIPTVAADQDPEDH